VSKLIAGAHHKFTKRIARVEVPTALACFWGNEVSVMGLPSVLIDRARYALIDRRPQTYQQRFITLFPLR
jgi:hypothetical protein